MKNYLTVLLIFLACFNHVESLYKDFSDNKARTMLTLAAASYSANPMICVHKVLPQKDHWVLVNRKVERCDIIQDTCSVYVIKSNERQQIIVSYRGTVGKNQLDEEINEALQPSIDWYGIGLVNKYFYMALNMTWDAVLPALTDESTKHYSVEFVGYSLGGALATLAATRTVKENLRRSDKVSLMTFGEPRVGNIIFAQNVDILVPNTYRVVHKADIVPHSPPCHQSGKYACKETDYRAPHHHGTEVWYNNDMHFGASYTTCTRTDEDENCSNSLGNKYTADDHLHYFQHNVGEYGQNNCVDTPDQNNGGSTTVSSIMKTFFLVQLFFILSILFI